MPLFLSAQTAPKISFIPNYVEQRNTVITAYFTAYDPDKIDVSSAEPDHDLTFEVTSSDPAVVIAENAVISHSSGYGWEIKITPELNVQGVSSTITIKAKDTEQKTFSRSFSVTYRAPDTAPVISGLPWQKVITQGTASSTTNFTVTDNVTTSANITFDKFIANNTIIASTDDVTISTLAGPDPSHSVKVVPVAAGQMGATAIRIRALDEKNFRTTHYIVHGKHLPAGGRNVFNQPYGIYNLDGSTPGENSQGVDPRDGNIRATNPDINGYVLRLFWNQIEPTAGDYRFDLIANAMEKLGNHQALSLIIVPPEPDYIRQNVIAAGNGSTLVWTDDSNGSQRVVPWSANMRLRRRLLMEALSTYKVDGIALKNHPRLTVVNPYLAGGHTGVRDPSNTDLLSAFDGIAGNYGYTRTKLGDAVVDEIDAVKDNFPNCFVNFGFFTVVDDDDPGTETLTDYLMSRIVTQFGDSVSLFQENLASSRLDGATVAYTGYPGADTELAAPLFDAVDLLPVSFQMLTAWRGPFNPAQTEKTYNAQTSDGIDYAFNTFGTRYFEVYTADFDDGYNGPALKAWGRYLGALSADTGTNTAPRIAIAGGNHLSQGQKSAVRIFTYDKQKSSDRLTVTASASPASLISAISYSGSGIERYVNFTPVSGSSGETVTVTVNVSDGTFTRSADKSIQIDSNTPPTIGTIADYMIPRGSVGQTVPLSIGDDLENNEGSIAGLIVTVTSSATLSDGTPIFRETALAPMFTNEAWRFILKPETTIPANTGTYPSTITVKATDGGGLSKAITFTATIDSAL